MRFIPPLVSSSWKEVLCLRAMLAKTLAGSHCKGRSCSCSGIPAPRCLSCLTRSCKCLRFLPGPFWYLVMDPWCMRDQALKLQTVVWSTKCNWLLGGTVAAGNFCHYFLITLQCCPFETLTHFFLLCTTTPSFSSLFLTSLFHKEDWTSPFHWQKTNSSCNAVSSFIWISRKRNQNAFI